MEQSIQQAIQEQLQRIGLASTENNIGNGGGLDVDFDYDENSDYVKIDDSQKQTIFDAFALLPALEALPVGSDWDAFWTAANPTVIH